MQNATNSDTGRVVDQSPGSAPVYIAGFPAESYKSYRNVAESFIDELQIAAYEFVDLLKRLERDLFDSRLPVRNGPPRRQFLPEMLEEIRNIAGTLRQWAFSCSYKQSYLNSEFKTCDTFHRDLLRIAVSQDIVLPTPNESDRYKLAKATSRVTLLLSEVTHALGVSLEPTIFSSKDVANFNAAVHNFRLSVKAWDDFQKDFSVTKEEKKQAVDRILQDPFRAYDYRLSQPVEYSETAFKDAKPREKLVAQRMLARLKPQWLVWRFLLPEWRYYDQNRDHYINASAVYWWRDNITGLPEGFKTHSIEHEDLEAHVFARLLLASAMDSTLLNYPLLEAIGILISRPLDAKKEGEEKIGHTYFSVQKSSLVYGLAMALITKIKHAMAKGKQLDVHSALTVLRAASLTKSIRGPEGLRLELEANLLLIRPLLANAVRVRSLVLEAIFNTVYKQESRNPADLLDELRQDLNIPYLQLDERVVLLGDALGFVCLTDKKLDYSKGHFYEKRIILLKDKIKIVRDSRTGARGFKVTNVHEGFEPEYINYCWKSGPLDEEQERVKLMIEMRDRKVSVFDAMVESMSL